MTPRRRQEAYQRGATAAAREHVRLGTDLERRVEVFDVIQQAGVWLMFQPLDIYGLYRRLRIEQGEIHGVLVNSKHPPSLQRFTAAHEYGHHVLGHEASVDDEEELGLARQARSVSEFEVEAQAFAANFLMPARLVYTVLRQLGLPREIPDITARQAYLISLELGASYLATVTQLLTLGVINTAAFNKIRDTPPIQIKQEIGRGRPQNSRADTWPLEPSQDGRTLYPRVEDELVLDLPEAPSTGYVWTLPEDEVVPVVPDPTGQAYLELARDEFLTPPETEEPLIGAGGVRHFVLRVLKAGRRHLVVTKRRPWLPSSAPKERFELNLEVAASPTGDADRGLSERQQPLLAVA